MTPESAHRISKGDGGDRPSFQDGPALNRPERDTRPPWKVFQKNADGLIVAITCLAVGLRLYHLTAQSLWVDEVMSIRIMTSPWSAIASKSFELTNSPPLYFLLSWPFYALIPNEAGARLLSALSGAATVPLLYLFASRLVNPRVGALSALLLAVSPFHIWYSQETRPYALAMFLALLSTMCMLQVETHGSRRFKVAYLVSAVLLCYTHLLAALVLFFHGVYWLIRRRPVRAAVVEVAGVAAIAAVSMLPVIPAMIANVNSITLNRPFTFLAIPYTIYTELVGFTFGPSTYVLHHATPAEILASYSVPLVVTALLAAVVGVYALLHESNTPRIRLLLMCWIVLPLVGLAFLDIVTPQPYNVRYVCHTVFPLMLVCAMGVDAPRDRWRRGVLLLAVLVVLLTSVGNHFWSPKYYKTDYRSAAAFLEDHAGAHDIILVADLTSCLRYYYKGPAEIRPAQASQDKERGLQAHDSEDMPAGTERVWLLEPARVPAAARSELAQAYADDLYRFDKSWRIPEFTGLQISTYRVDQPKVRDSL